MAKRKKSKSRTPPPMKGFRPGKEPPQLRKQQAKARLGSDAGWAQKQMVEAVGDKSPEEVQGMLRKWSIVLAIVGALLIGAGVFLYSVAIWAGILVHVLAAVTVFLLYRIRKQAHRLVEVADSIARGGRPGGR